MPLTQLFLYDDFDLVISTSAFRQAKKACFELVLDFSHASGQKLQAI